MSERVNCPTCGNKDETDRHRARCLHMHAARSEAVALGDGYGVPAVTTADLWAHLASVAAPADATRVVRQVLDLGWRPVVGTNRARIWATTPDPSDEQEASA